MKHNKFSVYVRTAKENSLICITALLFIRLLRFLKKKRKKRITPGQQSSLTHRSPGSTSHLFNKEEMKKSRRWLNTHVLLFYSILYSTDNWKITRIHQHCCSVQVLCTHVLRHPVGRRIFKRQRGQGAVMWRNEQNTNRHRKRRKTIETHVNPEANLTLDQLIVS